MDDPLHRAPGTPLLFAVARTATGAPDAQPDPIAAYWVQVAVGVALIAVVFALVRLLAGPRPALLATGAYLAAAAVTLARGRRTPRGSATTRRSSPRARGRRCSSAPTCPATGGSSGSARRSATRRAATNPTIRHVRNSNLRTEWIIDAVAARHPALWACWPPC